MGEHTAPARPHHTHAKRAAAIAVLATAVGTSTWWAAAPDPAQQIGAAPSAPAATPDLTELPTLTAGRTTTTATFVADTPEAQKIIDVLNGAGLALTAAESEVVVSVAKAEVAAGGYVAGRQAEIRAIVNDRLARLTDEQAEIVVDCVVKYNDMVTAAAPR